MRDHILHLLSVSSVKQELLQNYPEYVDEEGEVGFFHHNISVTNQDEMLVYCRLSAQEEAFCTSLDGVSSLGSAEYVGEGTADLVYSAVFDDPDAKAVYDRVYPRTPVEYEMMGDTFTYTPPLKFGIINGA